MFLGFFYACKNDILVSMEAQTKSCQNCKSDFMIEPDDFGFYEKIHVPPPTFCSKCRFQRRLMFRNERSFYKRKFTLKITAANCGVGVKNKQRCKQQEDKNILHMKKVRHKRR